MACARHSKDLETSGTENEKIRDVIHDVTAYVLPNETEVSPTETGTCPKCLIEADIQDIFYDRCVVYKDVSVRKSTVNRPSSVYDERRSFSRRSGRVDPPVAISKEFECIVDKTKYSYPHEEGKRNRNLSEGSYFATKKDPEATTSDDMCCDVDFPSDHVCPSRLRGFHGRYSVDNITNVSAIKCLRWRMRRNALCDPLHLLLPQTVRERLERDNQRRKTSMARKVSQFMTVNFDLDRDEDLI